jgi:thiamine biosynthesis lipoprotein
LLLPGILALSFPRNSSADWIGERIDLMGTSVSVELWHDDPETGQQLADQVIDEYRRIDNLMSTYKADSALSAINRSAARQAVPIEPEVFALIEQALMLSERSGGAFDISYESVGYLYDFRARRRPSAAEIDAGLLAIDYRSIVLDAAAGTIEFDWPGMRINLGGIAKGYAIERGASLLRARGVEHALLNAGGDSRVLGDRRGQAWIIGVRHPRAEGEVITRLPLVDEAVSTSGDYERFFDEDGVRYHHIINPNTGTPTNEMMSVTVIGPDATLTDGLSTTLFVLGMDTGLALIERFSGYEAILVDRSGRLAYSSGLQEPE